MAKVTLGEKCLLDCDLIVVRKGSFHARVDWERDGSPIDLRGATCKCQVRVENDGELICDLSPCWTFRGNGVVEVDISPLISSTVPPGKWPWDLMVTESNGYTTRVLAGRYESVDPISEEV